MAGSSDQRPGQRHALLLAAGELIRFVPPPLRQPDQRQEGIDPFLVEVDLLPVDQQRQGDVFLGGQRRQEVEKLEDETDVVAPDECCLPVVQDREAFARQGDLAGGGAIQPAEEVEQRRFAAARRPHDGYEFSFGDLEIQAGQRVDAHGAHLVLFAQTLRLENNFGHGTLPRSR